MKRRRKEGKKKNFKKPSSKINLREHICIAEEFLAYPTLAKKTEQSRGRSLIRNTVLFQLEGSIKEAAVGMLR
ncbi:hypothetical protein CEXT_162971 [Caerostris extrusa]|uniref:Uncharacterized protein n=1 Tax=Caerostris extrusa TaxID=172846 RepID=A0AAV4WUB7_CAEEX|nr:hypothetical protein CEXT_162971 [Caerostris extrusa]